MRYLLISPKAACLVALGLLAISSIVLSSARAQPDGPPAGRSGDSGPTLRTPAERFADLRAADEPSFRRHVIPLLARAGCSGRECHGSFQGRGGFQLSLFGSDWDHDHQQITQGTGGEGEVRVNDKEPEQSLVLLKPTMQVKHKGKERIKKDSWEYNLLLKWIKAGAKNDADRTGELERLEVTPSELVFTKPGEAVQLRVVARWKDGTTEDVTQITRFKTNDETVANVSDTGLVSNTGKGDSHVVAFYDSAVVPVPVMLPVSDLAGAKFPAVSARGRVDELVNDKLRKVGVVPSELCTDSEFLRRVSLDLTGTLPAPAEVTAFLSDPSPDKRAAKVEEMLARPSYAAWWTTRLCDYTGNSPRTITIAGNTNRQGGEPSRQWYNWIYKRVADNVPYDRIVADIVLSTSRSSPEQSYKDYAIETDSYFRSSHPADFADHPTLPYFWQRRTTQQPQEKALAFAHAFLGVRLECAQCHKHPFDRWTKRDGEQFTAFFTPIVSGPRPPAPGEEMSYQSLNKEIQEKANRDAEEQAPDMKSDMKMSEIGAKTEGKSDGKASGKTEAKPEGKSEAKGEAKAETKSEGKPDGKSEGKAAAKADAKPGAEASAADKKALQIFRQLQQKALNAEINRRIDAGEPVPWAELWVAKPGQPRPQGKGAPPVNNGPVTPKILGGEEVALTKFPDPRQPLMDWLRDKDNPYFAKALVNRVWANYFGRGIVDPPDDLNLANAPSNGELLDSLARGFIDHNFDMKWLHREIINSDTYQRSWKTNETNRLDARNFSHAAVRQLPAEVMGDAIDMAVASSERLASFPTTLDDRAIGPGGSASYAKGKAQKGGDTYFLTLFGRPLRETNCDCERSADPTLLQTIYTLNDPTLLAKLESGTSWVAELRRPAGGNGKTAAKFDADGAIEQAFRRTVSRPPTAQEREQARADLAAAKVPADGVRDLLWALINTREFKVNH